MGTYSQLRKKSPNNPPIKQTEPVVPVRPEPSEPPAETQQARVLKRCSHDLYIDQMKTLHTQTRGYFLMKGDNKSVAQMVREAIDAYIKTHQ